MEKKQPILGVTDAQKIKTIVGQGGAVGRRHGAP